MRRRPILLAGLALALTACGAPTVAPTAAEPGGAAFPRTVEVGGAEVASRPSRSG